MANSTGSLDSANGTPSETAPFILNSVDFPPLTVNPPTFSSQLSLTRHRLKLGHFQRLSLPLLHSGKILNAQNFENSKNSSWLTLHQLQLDQPTKSMDAQPSSSQTQRPNHWRMNLNWPLLGNSLARQPAIQSATPSPCKIRS
ncbi:UNVERIFIED_CONTAM: hypothetical protein Sangu_2872400 [Sesamum angustifolium]|uniref:Uncharacterized protein n=1 Tax=Sesamum angustifolium TaxID=2727405 RepID=A0AAW2IN97_9LAMI